jgi:hypothetical protein
VSIVAKVALSVAVLLSSGLAGTSSLQKTDCEFRAPELGCIIFDRTTPDQLSGSDCAVEPGNHEAEGEEGQAVATNNAQTAPTASKVHDSGSTIILMGFVMFGLAMLRKKLGL